MLRERAESLKRVSKRTAYFVFYFRLNTHKRTEKNNQYWPAKGKIHKNQLF